MKGLTFISHGLLGTMSLKEILAQLILVFIIASLVELFIVGPVAKKMALSLPYDKSKKVLVTCGEWHGSHYVSLWIGECLLFRQSEW